jgi:hypothetical protein
MDKAGGKPEEVTLSHLVGRKRAVIFGLPGG